MEDDHAPEAFDDGSPSMEVAPQDAPRIYVASLSDYNAGILHGEWIDAAQEPDEIGVAVTAMLARSPSDSRAEEFAIHDYEGFGHYRVGEYDSLEWVSRVARGIAEHGLVFAAWAEQCDHDREMLDRFEDDYFGEYESLTDCAEQFLEDFGLERIIEEHIPEPFQAYVTIDAEAFGNDLVLGGDITIVRHDGGVWVFLGRS